MADSRPIHELPVGSNNGVINSQSSGVNSRPIYELSTDSNSKVFNHTLHELEGDGVTVYGISPSTTEAPWDQLDKDQERTQLFIEHFKAEHKLDEAKIAYNDYFNKGVFKKIVSQFKSNSYDDYKGSQIKADLRRAQMRFDSSRFYIDKFYGRVK